MKIKDHKHIEFGKKNKKFFESKMNEEIEKKIKELKQEQKDLIEELINLTIEIENNQVELNKLLVQRVKALEKALEKNANRPKIRKPFLESIMRKKSTKEIDKK